MSSICLNGSEMVNLSAVIRLITNLACFVGFTQ